MHKANEGLEYLNELLDTGKIRPVIDRSYSLSEVPEALRYFAEEGARGKIIIKVKENE